MTDDKLKAAQAEAERFIAAARTLRARRKKDEWLSDWQGCRESGACRRASLDLTRALAGLRRLP
jgi:hypothetical protein